MSPPSSGGINWTAVSAVATLAAVLVALGIAIWDRRSATRAQARAVHARYGFGNPGAHRAVIENGSAAPIFNISLVAVKPKALSLGVVAWTGQSQESPLAKVAPQSQDSVDAPMNVAGQLAELIDGGELHDLVMTIEFTDAMSVRWRREGATKRPRRVRKRA